jgi:hypothetical protein
MNQREFRKYLDRDGHCPHCGTTDDTLIPQHRANRGHGGYKAGNTPANVIVLCSYMNWLIETDAQAATQARENGWKIGRYQDPATTPVHDTTTGTRWILDNDYGRTRAI